MKTQPDSCFFETRQRLLLARLDARDLPFLVVTKPANIFYLTGFRGSAGIAVFGPSGGHLLVDPRYTIQAAEQARGVEVKEVTAGLFRAAGRRLQKLRARRVGFEENHLTVEEFERLRKQGPLGGAWKPAGGLIEELRVVKDDSEISQIRAACLLTSRAYEEVLPQARPGVSERDLASELDFRMRRKGADSVAFETIVASGPRGALPHARPSAKALKAGELVIFDLGAILGGYAADMTRTVYLGSPGKRVRFLYEAVLEAQQEAIGALRAGVKAGTVNAAARRRLAAKKLDKLFTHSTGHGVGIEIHERPRIGRGEQSPIPAGSIVTVEPGIYIEDFGGVRIEDTVLVGAAGTQTLTPAAKDCWWLE
ncbi:MAG TPA: Xaa-Pro peptidase family protein [Terriglobia bacterium]|nr:Xaa-Pro peptidase family protein [Terriglobia bacterium]